ncbi:hypothetical protein H1C71_022463, partial [Ictidomys tridecemlineatus]
LRQGSNHCHFLEGWFSDLHFPPLRALGEAPRPGPERNSDPGKVAGSWSRQAGSRLQTLGTPPTHCVNSGPWSCPKGTRGKGKKQAEEAQGPSRRPPETEANNS